MSLSKRFSFQKHYFLRPVGVLVWIMSGFVLGYLFGMGQTLEVAQSREKELVRQFQEATDALSQANITPTPAEKKAAVQPTPRQLKPSYTGPELWEAVNTARVQHGVSPLSQKDILCTLAAIRLSQIRELGKLDGHDGFQPTYDKYKDNPTMPNNVSEFLISGYPTPNQAVEAWLDTLGHKKLITGGEYTFGCVYAQDGFGVAITGY